MEIIRAASTEIDAARGAVIAIGNFDGVHLGHQAVIDHAREQAEKLNAPLGVMSFSPHPRIFFAPAAPDFQLMNATTKAHRLEKLGIDVLYELPFDAGIAALSPEEFVKNILVDGIGVRHVTVGADFCFGKSRSGTTEDLARLGAQYGFGCDIAPLRQFAGMQISSTAIRDALINGKPRQAAKLLGHWHRIDGPVIHGEKRGRDLGFPTANMSINGLLQPKHGVYAVIIDVLTGPHKGSYHGAASIGVRPMFGENTPNCETFIFDFSGDLYGAEISVGLVEYLRPEMKFDGLPALMAQMQADCDQAKEILENL